VSIAAGIRILSDPTARIFARTGHSSSFYEVTKRGFDVVASLAGLIASAPIMGVTAILVRKNLGSPVIFSQNRPGKNGRIFRLHKFRTMLTPDAVRGLLSDADRLTPFGKTLRSLSIDELPTLWNVLMGDMSLVGPRPLLEEYLSLYSAEQSRRHEVRPGVTGLAQVSGRNALTWDEKFCRDLEYVENRSWRLDLYILLKTILVVIQRDGISAQDEATMPIFQGANSTTSKPDAI